MKRVDGSLKNVFSILPFFENREDNSIALTTQSGAIVVKMLQRASNLTVPGSSAVQEERVPLPIPRKSQLFLDQVL